MKLLILLSILFIGATSFAQEETVKNDKPKKEKKAKKEKKVKTSIKLENALVIGQMDTPEDRYSLEINLTDLFTAYSIKTEPSLNILKMGGDSRMLASDSLINVVKAKGIDTYVLVTVRGFDRKFLVGNIKDDFQTSLEQASFFGLYRMDAVSVSFQFKFFRDGKCVHAEMLKFGNIGSRETVLKRFRKKVNKRLKRKWTK
ncbi:MAG: biopolymer transport protein ExbD [Crocinitomicaceae bacterium]|jgi:biopolymer transport protein ExbD